MAIADNNTQSVMKFNSQSITLNKGINKRFQMGAPPSLVGYSIPVTVWDEAIKEFNDGLDKRHQVKEVVEGKEMDLLRIGLSGGTFYIWAFARELDANEFEQHFRFTFRGEVIFAENSEKIVDKLIINDLLYRTGSKDEEWKSIFRKELTA